MKLSTCDSYAPTVAWLSVVSVAVVNLFSRVSCLSRELHSSTRPKVAYTTVAASLRVDDTVPCPWWGSG